LVREQFRPCTSERETHFLARFAQLGRDKRQIKCVIDVFLALAGDNAMAFSQTVRLKCEPLCLATPCRASMCWSEPVARRV
jgi:hypothetical protein